VKVVILISSDSVRSGHCALTRIIDSYVLSRTKKLFISMLVDERVVGPTTMLFVSLVCSNPFNISLSKMSVVSSTKLDGN